MISIRLRTAALLSGSMALMLLASGAIIYWTTRIVLTSQFDATLAAKAEALIAAADLDDGRLEIDFDVRDFAGFGSPEGPDYFEVHRKDGQSAERSPSLADDHLPPRPREAAPRYDALTLPNGRSGRGVWKSFELKERRRDAPREMQLVVASVSGGLDQSLRAIAWILAVGCIAGSLLAAIVVRACLKLGLRPLDALGEQMRKVNAADLHERLKVDPLPEELRSIAEKLNEMLARLEESFARERRFSSHAAHELRTPLAELKAMTELVTRWPDEFDPALGREMLRVVAEAEALLDKLSVLSRAELHDATLERHPLDLREAVRTSLAKCQREIAERRLVIDADIENQTIQTDPVIWSAILNNLLGNAVSHAPVGTVVSVRASSERLSVTNNAPDLEPQDIPHLFERFWRKSQSRSERGHAGLGLSIVAACMERLGGSCVADLEKGQLTMRCEFKSSDPLEEGR